MIVQIIAELKMCAPCHGREKLDTRGSIRKGAGGKEANKRINEKCCPVENHDRTGTMGSTIGTKTNIP